ncbi:NADH-quinone oxidoreductase subunit B family protein [Heliophilum fasciatum]|uniref:[NiFe]-hydrogenase III apoprotein small subunit n=1 Tax=Heliophilum fasciatum TaxID=35700 RepID=A0A4R2RTY8_9FIRM|nr:oxidoreductase [Heliophilum fasciatum]MCW2278674.1 Ni,Fe-hydrogenase III small subunit [Heliophilum fasciatum]TCP62605.1 [NiFe]-hydrogenase III apoprotein small subunit [Heliophilum fasciatum]
MFRLLWHHLAKTPPSPPIAAAQTDGHAGEAVLVRPLPDGWCGTSVHMRHVDCGSCNGCDWELSALLNPVYDIQRYGLDFVASPRHADLLLVTGSVTRHLQEALTMTYEATPDPKVVVAVGDCACGAGPFSGAYACGTGAEDHVPVHLKIPGCPPSPAMIIAALRALLK